MGPIPKSSFNGKKIEGKYANYLEVGYNAFEFVLDFGQGFAENEEAERCSRIVTSPIHARAMMATLQEALDGFEKNFGTDKT